MMTINEDAVDNATRSRLRTLAFEVVFAVLGSHESRSDMGIKSARLQQAVADELIKLQSKLDQVTDLARANAPHTEQAGEVCSDDCEGCLNPVAAIIKDRNEARALAYQRGLELEKIRSQEKLTKRR